MMMTASTQAERVSRSSLPFSPTARAFFAALDSNDYNHHEASQQKQKHKKKNRNQSSRLQKRIQVLGWRNRHSQDDYYPVHMNHGGSVSFSVMQIQRGEVEGTYGTGATVWPASMVLLKYMEKHAMELIRDKRVVDLGAGTGLTSIAAAVLGARHVICTDGESNVVQLAADNVKHVMKQIGNNKDEQTSCANDCATSTTNTELFIHNCPIRVQKYWWGADTLPNGKECDVIVVSDCVLPKLYPIAPLVDALDQLLQKPNAQAILSYEHRYYPEYDPRDKFRELATDRQLLVQLVPLEEHDEVYSVDDIEIWRVVRNTNAVSTCSGH